ncbi:hypothetical protein Ancab_030043 [Ancistrocladus abbreviatus]
MEGRTKKYTQVSPERAKVWKERSPKYVQNRKVPVVYYLSRNRQLEHPHFIEVPLASPEGLYLRDVIERLNVLRGRGMASMYSWSCKRSYKNGFVWHDLCEDDLIFAAHGNEYVLKGSEIIEGSPTGHFSPACAFRVQNLKQLPEPSSRSQDETSSSSSLNEKEAKHQQEDGVSLSQHSSTSGVSPESIVGNHSSCGGSLSLTEYKVFGREGATDASTQTDDSSRRDKPRETCNRGVSTDDGSLDSECNEDLRCHGPSSMHNSKLDRDSVSPTLSSSGESSSGRNTKTLESLIRADASKMNSSRILEEEGVQMATHPKLKASNMLMQLLSCGSISVKDHSFGLISTYKPTLFHSKFPSPLFSTSIMLGEVDCLSDNRRLTGLRLEDEEYFSGGVFETKMLKDRGDGRTSLKRSSSYNADRTSKQLDSVDDKEMTLAQPKCILQAVKASLIKQPRSESMRSPISDKPRISVDGADESQIITPDVLNGGSKRMTEASSQKKGSNRLNSREVKEKIIKIEESSACFWSLGHNQI